MSGYLDERRTEFLARLGKHSTGKGCVSIKRLSDIDPVVLRALIESAHHNRPAASPPGN